MFKFFPLKYCVLECPPDDGDEQKIEKSCTVETWSFVVQMYKNGKNVRVKPSKVV